jgi:hypothetical protein
MECRISIRRMFSRTQFKLHISVLFVLFLILFLPWPQVLQAHDIPTDVTVQMFVKPQGERLQVLVRVPLGAMRDLDFPERAEGNLDLSQIDILLQQAATLWVSDPIEIYEGTSLIPKPTVLATRISLPSDRSFESYDAAFAHITGPKLPNETDLYWNQAMMDVLFAYPIHSDQARFSIHPALARLGSRVVIVLRFVTPGGSVRALEFLGDPGLIRLDPHWYQAASRFVGLGFHHILEGTDHLLFLFCLVIPFRRFKALIPIVTAFTIAHSITLIASAYNLAPGALWFPPLIETLIAISIVYMALENIVGGISVQHRWAIAFGFGLVHGFGFSFALKQTLQFAGSHLLTSLLSFNIGVELGQLVVLALLIPMLDLLFRFVVAERMGTIIASTLVAHTSWHWMLDRAARLRQYRFTWPLLTPVVLLSWVRWVMVFTILAAIVWVFWALFGERPKSKRNPLKHTGYRVFSASPAARPRNAAEDN